jgi:hypothetical protein
VESACVRAALFEIGKLIDVWSGGVTRRSADLDLLLIADCADGRRVHACVYGPSWSPPARLGRQPRMMKGIATLLARQRLTLLLAT